MSVQQISHTYLLADSHLVTVSAFGLVANGIPTTELTKLKSVTAKMESKEHAQLREVKDRV